MSPIQRALDYLSNEGRPIDLAWAREQCADGTQRDVLDALAAYQNPDGGFGQRLEVDISAPASNAFATRLAMIVLNSVGAPSESDLVQRLEHWLEESQAEDGDWPFSPAIYDAELAPWFAAWTFPSLNPALCLAGHAARLGIGSERLHARVRTLADEKSSLAEIAEGRFYDLLPYVEYYPWGEHPRRDEYLDALALSIVAAAERGDYEDASHFFDHVSGGGPLIESRLPAALISAQLERLRGEQNDDGGWPTPYDQAWRSWTTAAAVITLHKYSD
ncbi:MAG: hypothetical protein M3R06_01705 [Chloroflexota bacterium]|nr:hypothetical protein [Chloroflexota bacterium]